MAEQIEQTKEPEQTKESQRLRKRLVAVIIGFLLALALVGTATYAWYVYSASRHVTDVKMAAGTGVTLLISGSYEGPYKANTGMTFDGLLNPVSTDQVRHTDDGKGGFQTVTGYIEDQESKPSRLAAFFGEAKRSDFYETSLYLTTNSLQTDVYLADIVFEDSNEDLPLSSTIRVCFVVHDPGEDQPEVGEFIWEITDKHNPQAEYNTLKGESGCVLDSSKTDGSVVEFSPLNSTNYAIYDSDTGKVSLKADSTKICTLPAAEDGAEHGTSVQVDVYVWMEGCDPDCTGGVGGSNLNSLSFRFAGVR